MAKVSKNARVTRGGGGKDHVKVVVCERDPKPVLTFINRKLYTKTN